MLLADSSKSSFPELKELGGLPIDVFTGVYVGGLVKTPIQRVFSVELAREMLFAIIELVGRVEFSKEEKEGLKYLFPGRLCGP